MTSTSRTWGISRGTEATTAPIVSASFRAEMATASLWPEDAEAGRGNTPPCAPGHLPLAVGLLSAVDALNVPHNVDAVDPGLVEAGATVDLVPSTVAGPDEVVPGAAQVVVTVGPAPELVAAVPAAE